MSNKHNKKLDKLIVKLLTEICEQAKLDTEGFVWITHLVNFDSLPDSLKIVCAFESLECIAKAREKSQIDALQRNIIAGMFGLGLDIKSHQIVYLDEISATRKYL